MATMANGQKKADGLAAMGDVSTIEWTDATWNPIRGCESVSEECRFCYAAELASRFADKWLAFEGLAKRSAKRGLPQWTGKTMFLVDRLGLPQDISEDDARAEGVDLGEPQAGTINGVPGRVAIYDARKAFAVLWDTINGKRAAWTTNPWVWALSFSRVGRDT